MVSFLFGGNTGETPETLKRKREMIEMMMTGTRTPQNWGEGIGAVMKGIASGVMNKRANAAENAGRQGAAGTFSKIFSGITGGVTPDRMPGGNIPMSEGGNQVAATTPGGNVGYRDAIASIESKGSGNYGAVGPTHDKLGRALGRYQIMEANIGPWAKAALGKSVTPDEFMANPELQDKIFDHRFGQYVEKYGPEGAAQAWLGGEGGVGKTGRKDSLGTSIGSYGKRFMSALGPQGGQKEVASISPEAAFEAITSANPDIPFNADPSMRQNMAQPSLTDEVAAFQQTPEYHQQFPGMEQQQPMALAQQGETGQGHQAIGNQMATPMQGSQQLADASGGMMPALNGGQPASAEQIAQAQQLGQQQADQGQGAGGASLEELYAAASNPWLSPEQQSIVGTLIEQKLQQQDPMRQMQLEKGRIELDQLRNPLPEYDFVTGRDGSIFRTDKRGNLEQVYGGKPDLPNDVQEYEYARQQGYQGTFADWSMENKKAGASQVNIDQKAEGAFDKKLAEKQAEAFDVMATEGLSARADLGVINELDALLQGQGGTLTGLSGIAAKYGIGGEGVDDLQAAQAMINKLVPTQRTPGSGSMSDRDVELFTRSLPNLWNTPGGNQKIINVMRGLAEYRQGQGEIADQVIMGEMSRQEARRALRELPNPLADLRGGGDKAGKLPADGSQPITREQYEALPSGAEFIAPDGSRRRKP